MSPTPRTLAPVDYWHLRARCSETQRLELVALQARAALLTARQQQDAALTALGLDPAIARFDLDDDACTITVRDALP